VTGIQKANFLNSNQKEKKTSEGVTETEHRIVETKPPCGLHKFTVAATEALKRRKSAPEEEKKAP